MAQKELKDSMNTKATTQAPFQELIHNVMYLHRYTDFMKYLNVV